MNATEKAEILKAAKEFADIHFTFDGIRSVFISAVEWTLLEIDKRTVKLGDKVLIIRPKTKTEREESPSWTPSMDKYDHTIQTIKAISPSGAYVCNVGFYFSPKWCKKIKD